MSNLPKTKPVIGIVGGVGAGKSTTAAQFVRLGCRLIDADAIGHELLRQDDVKQLLRERWGPGILTSQGEIDRRALGDVVFDDKNKGELEALNRIMQPRIGQRLLQEIQKLTEIPEIPAIVLDAAIMIEAGWDQFCTHVVFVEAPDRIRAKRLAEGRGWSEHLWREREKSQFSLDRKKERCYFTINNSSSVSCLYEQVRDVLQQIVSSAGRS